MRRLAPCAPSFDFEQRALGKTHTNAFALSTRLSLGVGLPVRQFVVWTSTAIVGWFSCPYWCNSCGTEYYIKAAAWKIATFAIHEKLSVWDGECSTILTILHIVVRNFSDFDSVYWTKWFSKTQNWSCLMITFSKMSLGNLQTISNPTNCFQICQKKYFWTQFWNWSRVIRWCHLATNRALKTCTLKVSIFSLPKAVLM
jgi:hypothetical protein